MLDLLRYVPWDVGAFTTTKQIASKCVEISDSHSLEQSGHSHSCHPIPPYYHNTSTTFLSYLEHEDEGLLLEAVVVLEQLRPDLVLIVDRL